MKVLCYQRFSTDKQSDRTIADQRRECHEFAKAQGWTVVADYADEGISGAKLSRRPGMQALLAHAEAGGVDIVTAVDLSRISRSLAHTAGIFDRLHFRGIRIHTRADGLIDETMLGMLGTFASMTRKMSATRTRDALRSLARDGFATGGRTYGYRSVEDGTHKRLVLDEAEAEVVRTIYRRFASGESPRQIAAGLNAEGIKGPTGGTWRQSTIAGNRLRGTGILANPKYVGESSYGKREFRLDPQVELRRPARFGDGDRRPEKDWVKHDDAKLRIIDDALWARVQTRFDEIESHTAAIRKKHGSAKARAGRHAVHLLSGILKCGVCGGPMSLVNASKYGCADAFDKRTCNNRSYLRRDVAEQKIIATIRFEMCSADGLRHAAQRIRAAVEARLAKAGGATAANVKALAKVDKGLAKHSQGHCRRLRPRRPQG